jgi:hypothetical protein
VQLGSSDTLKWVIDQYQRLIQAEAMWYYSQNRQQMGPVSEEEMKSKLHTGLLVGNTLVWKDGMSDWKPISEVPELFTSLNSFAPPSVTGGSPSQNLAPPAIPINPYLPPVGDAARDFMPQATMEPPINGGGILAFAIVVTLLCCLPFGVVGIVYAAQINSKKSMGDYLGAQESARKAMMWNWIGFGIGLGITVLAFFSGLVTSL